ncbi:MAG: hypothetical protein FWF29_06485, partial [Treponema sp.]|nr:hypothetical protein [Treponema sp.]
MKLIVKIPLLIGAVVLISAAGIIIATEHFVTAAMETATFNEMSSNASADAELLKVKIDGFLGQLWEIANRARTRTMDWEGVVRANLAPDVSRIGCLDLGLVTPDGLTRYVDEDSVTNLGDRDYIKKAFAGVSNISDAIISRATNKLVVMLAAPVYKNDTPDAPVLGVLVARRDGGTFLESLLSDIKLSNQNSYGFLINYEGTYTAHPDESLVLQQFNPITAAQKDPSLQSLADMVSKAIKNKEGTASYIDSGKKMICAYTEIPGH